MMGNKEVIELSPHGLEKLIAMWFDGKQVKKGTFFCRERVNQYVGVDNRTGDMWVKNFKSKRACFKWLSEEI